MPQEQGPWNDFASAQSESGPWSDYKPEPGLLDKLKAMINNPSPGVNELLKTIPSPVSGIYQARDAMKLSPKDAAKEAAKQTAFLAATQGVGALGEAGMAASKTLSSLGPAMQSVMRGITGMVGQQAGNVASNAVVGDPLTKDALSPTNLIGTAMAGAAPTLAGITAKMGSESRASTEMAVRDALKSTTGLDSSNPNPQATFDMMKPVQAGVQNQVTATAADRQAFESQWQAKGQALTGELVDKQAAHAGLQDQLTTAQDNLTAATQTGNQALAQAQAQQVNTLKAQIAQTKTGAQQAAGAYLDTKQQLQTQLAALEKRDASPSDIKDLKQTIKSLDLEHQRGQNLFRVSLSTDAEKLASAKTAPVKLNFDEIDKLPESINFQTVNKAVADSNNTISSLKLQKKQWELTKLPPDLAQADPAKAAIMKDLADPKASVSEFNEKLLKPNYVETALAAMPNSAPTIQKGVFNTLLAKSINPSTGSLDPKLVQALWNGPDGQGLAALRSALGKSAEDVQPLQQTINQFSKWINDTNKFSPMKWVKHEGTYIGFRVLMGIGALAESGHFPAATGAGVATSVGAIGAVMTMDRLTQYFFTNPTFRQGALDWAAGSSVGKLSSDAARYFSAVIHASAATSQNEP